MSMVKNRTNPEIKREEFIAYLTGAHVERSLFTECMGLLIGLEDEWRAQGATDDEIALTAFGFDYVKRCGVGVSTGFFPGLEPVLLEEGEDYRIERDRYGRKVKLCLGAATIALPLEYPVQDTDDWQKIKKYYEYSSERFAAGWAETAKAAREEGALINMGVPGGFDELRQLMGEEELCYAFYEDPELIHEILGTIGDTVERLLDEITRKVTVDYVLFHEDMAGKSGPLVGPNIIHEFIKPYYRRVTDLLASRGCRIFAQDSDGNMNSVIDAFLDCGINYMFPFEPAAGMDIVKTREKYGSKLMMLGGIDKHVLRGNREKIRTELEYKLQPSMRQGGCVFCLDHRIPNGTPIENYRYYVKTAREILGLDPNPLPGWQRMAF